MQKTLIGIDIGTTGTKSMLISEHGEVIAYAYAGYGISTPMLNRHEQDANDWWKAVVQTVRSLMSDPTISQSVTAISLSTQGGTLVATDRLLNPLRPAIVWSDTRCEEERQAFEEQFGSRYMYENSGWSLSRGLNALQIAWLRRREPEVFDRAAWFLSVHDFISFKLTGKPVVDMSNAGINQLVDIRKGAYNQSILDFAGVDEKKLPVLVRSGTPIGKLTKEAARELGLHEGVTLVAGAHDQYAGLLGAGVTKSSDILVSGGTAWVVTALSDQPDFSTGFAQSVSAVPDKWGMLVSLSTGGVSLDWLMKSIVSSESHAGGTDYQRVNQAAAQTEPGCGGLMFFPYFNGAFFPVADMTSKASFLGIDLSHNSGSMVRAVMEGVAYHIAWMLEYFHTKAGSGLLKFSGGASKSRIWSQMLADMTDQAVHIPELTDLPCLGAAIMAGVGSGVFKSISEAQSLFFTREQVILPDPVQVGRYAQLQREYRKRAKELGSLYRL